MRKRILNYVGFMIILSMVLTFVSASTIMYVKTNEWMEQDVRNEAQYVRLLQDHRHPARDQNSRRKVSR